MVGSEWNKWDLHIHTPASIVQYYGKNDDETWEKFITDLENLPIEFKSIGINDYLFLDGYKKVLEYKKSGRLKKIELILPVVEFRIEKFAGVDFGNLKRINLHIIFSNQLTIEQIQSQFLNGLEQSYTLEKGGSEWNRAITKESIAELGKKIKETVPLKELYKYGSDIEEGFNNLNVKEDKIFELLNRDIFKDKYLIAIGKTEWDKLKWSDNSIATKKSIINKANIIFTASESPEKWATAKRKLKEQEVKDLLLDCSDAHYFSSSNNKDRIGNSFTWIKANTTFEGLSEILFEPDERIFVGEIPELLERVKANKTKFIKNIFITKIDGYTEEKGIWFKDLQIMLNYGMVSIIGNKGNGKSALTDIIGLCGNSHHYEDFSFLNRERFLKDGLAKNFKATLEWADGDTVTRYLSDSTDFNAPERVRYLPQSFFEKLTNNLESYEFEKTLEDIVFSYLPDEEKLGRNSFSELIQYKKESIKKDIELIEKEINNINIQLIELENKAHPTFKEKLEKELKIKKKELEEHQKIKPQEVKNPDLDESTKDHNEEITKKLDEKNKNKDELEKIISDKKEKLIILNQEIEELTNIKEDFNRFEDEIKRFLSKKKENLKKYSIDIEQLFQYQFNLIQLENKIDKKKKEHSKITKQLLTKQKILSNYPTKEHKILEKDSYIIQLEKLDKEIRTLKNELSSPYKKYQDFKEKLKTWEKEKSTIEGNETELKTIKWYNAQIKYIEERLNNEISNLRKKRLDKTVEILSKKLELVNIYNKLKGSVDSEIKSYKGILKDYEINIDVDLKLKSNFSDKFLYFINQNKMGSFYQKDQGKQRIKLIVENKNFQKNDTLEEVLKELIENLEYDKRQGYHNERRYINEQVNSEINLDFYNFIFSIDYLEPSYELKLGDKYITELSPGEKGAMLIVFYLMLDKDNIPLIIDQPEENLDNESIYKILVHFIKQTKKRRQVILVTHNPNLAIVGDSEQLIYVSIDKKNKNKVDFESGAIENPNINEFASKILEGTIKAFDIRRLKYFNV
ncbi:MAG: hypothetical protein APR63_02120 [Desulfuromonas sp. SDB]|nr:MAG: hypothetical protein APR63_02120 [Desulfuromonas sp. SDB]